MTTPPPFILAGPVLLKSSTSAYRPLRVLPLRVPNLWISRAPPYCAPTRTSGQKKRAAASVLFTAEKY